MPFWKKKKQKSPEIDSEPKQNSISDFEIKAFEGIDIDFQFKGKQPSFGDLFLIVGYENPNFPPENREFENLNHLGFEQVDDYFGIRNQSEIGSDVKLWLHPLLNGEEVYHHSGPFDAIRLRYCVRENPVNTSELFEQIYNEFNSKLEVNTSYLNNEIQDFNQIKEDVDKTIEYCRNELNVEPGSTEALQLDW